MRLIRKMQAQPQAVDSTLGGTVHAVPFLIVLLAAAAIGRPSAAAGSAMGKPSDAPVIYSVSALPRVAHAGDSVRWDAHVSQNVKTVVARVAVYSFSLYPLRYGHFGEVFAIPRDVPPFFHGNYSVTITASTASGASTSRSIALVFQ